MPHSADLPSIHHRRRWFYALWVLLLAVAAVTLVRWEMPARRYDSTLQVVLRLGGAPAGTRVQAWAGPKKRWPGPGWDGTGACTENLPLAADGVVILAHIGLRVAIRRWVPRDFIARSSTELVMLRITAPGQAPRFLELPMGQDIRSGIVQPKHTLTLDISTGYSGL